MPSFAPNLAIFDQQEPKMASGMLQNDRKLEKNWEFFKQSLKFLQITFGGPCTILDSRNTIFTKKVWILEAQMPSFAPNLPIFDQQEPKIASDMP